MKFLLYLFLSLALCLQAACAALPPNLDRPWNQDVVYFVLTDRFFDGDPDNNRPAGSDPALYDAQQEQIDLYHGGDFRGLELALESGYFNRLGVTALWITPPVRNVWHASYDLHDAPKTGYHGYWAQDFLDIDPHLVSSHSLDGTRKYADSREGRLQHYKDLVELARSRGIKIVQDIVTNHAGPVFYYDVNGNGAFDLQSKREWIQPYRTSGHYENAKWTDKPEWNLAPTKPDAPLKIFGRELPLNGALGELSSYGRRGMSRGSLGASGGEEIRCDFFSLRDFNTDPDSQHFDALVDDFVEIYAFYLEEIGVDGFRIDTVKHVHHGFWDAFTKRLRERVDRERAEELILFGEVYDGNPAALGKYTYRKDWPEEKAPSIDSLLNFQFCYAVRDYLRTGDESFGTARGIEHAIRALAEEPPPGRDRPYYNPTPGPDGLNASQKVIHFVENHDGINRFRVRGVTEQRHFLANALTLTMPGIPCLYYGSETALPDPQAGPQEDAETGRLTYIHRGDSDALGQLPEDDHFQAMAELIDLRKKLPALHGFEIQPLWVDSPSTASDDGIFAFTRGRKGESPILCVMNASGGNATTSVPGHVMPLIDSEGSPLLQPGQKLKAIPLKRNAGSTASVDLVWEGPKPKARITVGRESFHMFKVVRD